MGQCLSRRTKGLHWKRLHKLLGIHACMYTFVHPFWTKGEKTEATQICVLERFHWPKCGGWRGEQSERQRGQFGLLTTASFPRCLLQINKWQFHFPSCLGQKCWGSSLTLLFLSYHTYQGISKSCCLHFQNISRCDHFLFHCHHLVQKPPSSLG